MSSFIVEWAPSLRSLVMQLDPVGQGFDGHPDIFSAHVSVTDIHGVITGQYHGDDSLIGAIEPGVKVGNGAGWVLISKHKDDGSG